MNYQSYIREMPGKNRCDLSRLLADAATFQAVVRDLAAPFRDSAVDKVAALDAMGFALGGSVAAYLNAGIVLIRKSNKVAWSTQTIGFVDYTGEQSEFEIADDSINPGDIVLVIDDWAETGGQLRAAIALLERMGAVVIGAALLNVDDAVRSSPEISSYRIHSIL